jgi:hypothetical protein
MSNDRKTNIVDFFGECNAGILAEKIAVALSDAAMAQINHGGGNKKAKLTIEFGFQQMGDNEQVIVSHKLSSSLPTKRGKKAEEDVTETAFFVGKGGQLTINQPVEEEGGQFGLTSEIDGLDKETGEFKKVRRIGH